MACALVDRHRVCDEIVQFWKIKHRSQIMDTSLLSYFHQISEMKSTYDFEIEKDIERTFPNEMS